MNLTPIKVRGKGPRKAGFRPPDPKRRKTAVREADAKNSSIFEKDTRAAPIEKLPTELLQLIFLLSREPNFPKASMRIGRLVSNRSVYVDLVLQAFTPTWDLWMGVVKAEVKSYHGWFEDHERFGGDPVWQSKIIALPFMSIQLIEAAMDRWARDHKEKRHYLHSGDSEATDYPDDGRNPGDGVTEPGGVRHKMIHEHIQSAADCFEEEFNCVCFYDVSDSHISVLGGGKASRLEVHPAIRIPDRLLTGPFSSEDVKLLFWLMHNNAVVADDQSWELALRGIGNLFQQDNVEIANLVTLFFYAVGAFKQLPADVLPISLDRARLKLQKHPNVRPVYKFCSWKSIVYRLFDLVGKTDLIAHAYGNFRPRLERGGKIPWGH